MGCLIMRVKTQRGNSSKLMAPVSHQKLRISQTLYIILPIFLPITLSLTLVSVMRNNAQVEIKYDEDNCGHHLDESKEEETPLQ